MGFKAGKEHHNYKHGQGAKSRQSGAYKSWKSMLDRCNPSNANERPVYAGAGVTVCQRWAESFEAFYADMGDRPTSHSIDRIDPLGNYEPGNCRWASTKEQALNRRNTTMTEVRGESLCLHDVSIKYGVPNTTVVRRYEQGLRGEELISRKNRNALRKGSAQASAKLNEALVAEMKAGIARGERNVDLARTYGVSGAVVSEIRHGKLWAHVAAPVTAGPLIKCPSCNPESCPCVAA